MIRILVADSDAVVRRGLNDILGSAAGMAVTGEAADGREALERVRQHDFDVAILDIRMPSRGGPEIIKELRSVKPDMPILVFSVFAEEHYAIRSLRDGASAYLTKDRLPEEIIEAVRTVAAGRRYITPSLAEKLAAHLHDSSADLPHEKLSNREMQVFVRLACGTAAKEIAEEFTLSVKTVSTYRARILQKMGMTTNAQLIRYAIEQNIPC